MMSSDKIPDGLADVRSRHFLDVPRGWVAFAVEDVLEAAGAPGLAHLRARGGVDATLPAPVSRGIGRHRVMRPLPRPPLAVIYVQRDVLPDVTLARLPR
jgi:hypothetical protein